MILILICLCLIVLLGYQNYKSDKHCLALSTLQEKFSTKLSSRTSLKFNDEIVYFMAKNEKRHYVNGLGVASSNEGIYFKGGFIYPWIKSFFIPWSALTRSGEMKSYFTKKNIYLVAGSNVSIAVSKRHLAK